MLDKIKLKQIIEGLLMASERPLHAEDLHKIIYDGNNSLEFNELKSSLNELVEEYKDCGIELKEVASGWRFQVKQDLSHWINKLYEVRPPRYSRALLETLALIAYRQPITRAEIESVRGVTVSTNIMKTLVEHEWVRIVGYKEVPGKPAIFATTKKFLDHFNLKNLEELPPLMEFTESLIAETKAENEGDIALANETPLEVDDSAIISEEPKETAISDETCHVSERSSPVNRL